MIVMMIMIRYIFMSQLMLLHIPFRREALVTDFTLVWPLFSMRPIMHVQGRITVERFLADVAFEVGVVVPITIASIIQVILQLLSLRRSIRIETHQQILGQLGSGKASIFVQFLLQ